jgi:hypothetical protein
MVRVESGQTVTVNELQDAYGDTPDEAVTNLEASVKEWMKDQTRTN